jgi:hypothetical protein
VDAPELFSITVVTLEIYIFCLTLTNNSKIKVNIMGYRSYLVIRSKRQDFEIAEWYSGG